MDRRGIVVGGSHIREVLFVACLGGGIALDADAACAGACRSLDAWDSLVEFAGAAEVPAGQEAVDVATEAVLAVEVAGGTVGEAFVVQGVLVAILAVLQFVAA